MTTRRIFRWRKHNKKKLKKGTYTIQIKVKAAGNSTYAPVEKTVKVKVKVK